MTKATDKSLQDKAINIKGKQYVLVSDRVLYFNEIYPNGCIKTARLSEWDKEVIKATVIPDCTNMDRCFNGYSQATWWDGYINKTSALENAETSAVGRALAMMWIWVIDSIASMDEINKAENTAKAQKNSKYQDDNWNPLWWFQKAINNEKFMLECLNEDDFINKIKWKYNIDNVIEWQLREAYKKVCNPIIEDDDLPFKD